MTSAPVTACIIEALPEEVLGMIFEEHAKLEWRAPVIDGQVCRQWQRTVLRRPRAWAHLDIVENFISAPSKLHQWLGRSGSAPLHIHATNFIHGGEEVVDQHHKRIKSISTRWCLETLAVFEKRSFPILQSLSIMGRRPGNAMLRWSAWRTMPALRSLRASHISMDSLPSNAFRPLKVLALYTAKDCDCFIRHSYHSLTSLMLGRVSLQYTSEPLEFPSLRFLSLFAVENVKHRMNAPALTTYHESGRVEEESFPMPLPFLIEYGIYRLITEPPLNVTKVHQRYPNISRISFRAHPSDVKQFLRSLRLQPTALPMLRLLAVEAAYDVMKYSGEDKYVMMNDVFVRNMASSVKMELCFDGKFRVPLYFGHVRVSINEGRNELTSTLRSRMSAIENLSFVLGLWLSWIKLSTYIVSQIRTCSIQ
jgi:hypothetical protein